MAFTRLSSTTELGIDSGGGQGKKIRTSESNYLSSYFSHACWAFRENSNRAIVAWLKDTHVGLNQVDGGLTVWLQRSIQVTLAQSHNFWIFMYKMTTPSLSWGYYEY